MQIELIVSWSIDDILREVAAEGEVVQLRTNISGQAVGATGDQRVAIGKLVKGLIDRHREYCRSRIVATVRSVAADLVENALMDDRMVVNLALLLPKNASDVLDLRLADLDEEFGVGSIFDR